MMTKERLKAVMPAPLYAAGKYGWYALQFLSNSRFRTDRMIKYKYRQRQVRYGEENPDKIFYVIRNIRPEGMFSWHMLLLGHLAYAEKMGYIAVVDQMSLQNPLFDKELIGKENVWEYFFEQPFGYSLEDISSSRNVILSNAISVPDKKLAFSWRDYEYNKDQLYWSNMTQKYIRFNHEMRTYVEQEYNKHFTGKEKVLGVAIRRSDKVSMAKGDGVAAGMMIESELSDLMELVEQYLEGGRYQNVFMTSDDQESIELMKERFGDKCFCVDRKRWNVYVNGRVNDGDVMSTGDDHYTRNYKYISEIVLLSRCDALIGGRNGGAIMASLMSGGKYEFFDIRGEGWYPTKGVYYKMVDGMARLQR